MSCEREWSSRPASGSVRPSACCPTQSHLEAATRRGMPASAGVALGYDRLLMWLWGFERIDDVIAFPWERA